MFSGLPIASPVLLAPMAGVTDAPFRRLVMRFGAGLVYSEMIASRLMVDEYRRGRDSPQNADYQADNFPCAVQLAGCEPDILAEAAKLQSARGAPLIDLNFGCPVKKVVTGSAGSALMRDLPKAAELIKATVQAVNIPITIKMRLGWDDDSINAPELAHIAEDLGIKMITVHGRTRAQLYNGIARWDAVAAVKQAVNIPVIVNGDIRTPENAKEALYQSGADGVMIARGAQGKPWVLSQIIDYLENGIIPSAPPKQAIGELLLNHYNDMLDHYGTYMGNQIARKHIGWTLQNFDNTDATRSAVNQMTEPQQVKDILCHYFTI